MLLTRLAVNERPHNSEVCFCTGGMGLCKLQPYTP